jgi:hypothetical protein
VDGEIRKGKGRGRGGAWMRGGRGKGERIRGRIGPHHFSDLSYAPASRDQFGTMTVYGKQKTNFREN